MKHILFISLEDCMPFFGCYGHPQVKTPNIDGLAKDSMVFRNNFAQASVCNPSRASVITGKRPETTGVLGNFDEWRDKIPADTGTLPQFFHDRGYRTLCIGKVVHQTQAYRDLAENGDELGRALWDEVLENPGDEPPEREAVYPKTDWPAEFADWEGAEFMKKSMRWGPTGRSAEEHSDAKRARRAAEVFFEEHDKPFFLGIGFKSTHYAFRPPQEFFDMYYAEDIMLPNVPANSADQIPVAYPPFNTADEKRLSDEDKRQLYANYFACVSYVDYCVGILVDKLKEAGIYDETVICLWTDHGLHFGEHGFWRKETLFNEVGRVPLIIKHADHAYRGATEELTELVDIYPTLAELCGFDAPDGLEGTSLVPLMANPSREWKKGVFSIVRRGNANRSIRTKKWRYSEWGGPTLRELYDEENDPREYRNLAYDPDYAGIRREMAALLRKGWRACLPRQTE